MSESVQMCAGSICESKGVGVGFFIRGMGVFACVCVLTRVNRHYVVVRGGIFWRLIEGL